MNVIEKLYLTALLVIARIYESNATWYETVDADGENSVHHTIPRIKRVPESLIDDENNYSSEKFVETAVPSKKSAFLFDRLMVALQKAVDDDEKSTSSRTYYPEFGASLQRRGQEKGTVYWRCYFNVVTCFR